ncbi:helix-turn-helix domain-containing protein [Gracilibacillus sp. Marseille-QA3620]
MIRKERNELGPKHPRDMAKLHNQDAEKNRLANKIDQYLVVCIYESGVRNEANAVHAPQWEPAKANSFVVFEKVYRESEDIFKNLRVAARHQIITSIAANIVEILEKQPSRMSVHKASDRAKLIEKVSHFIKNETFLAEENVWEDFCAWFRCSLTEWVLDEMIQATGHEQIAGLESKELNQLFHEYLSQSLSNEEFTARFSELISQHISGWIEEIFIILEPANGKLEKLYPQQANTQQELRQQQSLSAKSAADYIHVMNNVAYQNVREALYKKSFHSNETNPWPTTPLYKGNMEGIIQFKPPFFADDWLTDLPINQAWREAESVSDLDVDVFDALCSVFLSKASHSKDVVEVYFDELLQMRGLKAKLGGEGRRGGYEQKQRRQVLESLSRIQSLWLEIEKAVIYEKGRPVEMKLQGRTFLFKDSAGKECRVSEYTDKKHVYFTIDDVFARYLYGSGRQIAILPIKALHYHPHHRTWEKRLARYVSWRWRTQARKGDYWQPNKIATLLHAIGEDVNERTPSRTRDRLEKALDTLQDDGLIGGWYYDNKWDEAVAETRGWYRIWENAAIIIEPPAVITEQYQSIQKRKKTKSSQEALMPLSSLNLLGQQLRLVRSHHGLTLNQVAEVIGISPSYLSHIECGRKHPSDKIQMSMTKWIQRYM